MSPQIPEADAEAVQGLGESRACLFGVVLIKGSPRMLYGNLPEGGPQVGELSRPQQIEQPLGLMGDEHVERDRFDQVLFDDPGGGSGQHERFDCRSKQRGLVVHDLADERATVANSAAARVSRLSTPTPS